jgi:hypothetical protein
LPTPNDCVIFYTFEMLQKQLPAEPPGPSTDDPHRPRSGRGFMRIHQPALWRGFRRTTMRYALLACLCAAMLLAWTASPSRSDSTGPALQAVQANQTNPEATQEQDADDSLLDALSGMMEVLKRDAKVVEKLIEIYREGDPYWNRAKRCIDSVHSEMTGAKAI